MRTCRCHDFRTDDLNDSHTQLQHAQDELIATQSYIHHLKTELHGRDEQLEVSQAQTTELQHEVEHLQELFPFELVEPEETEGMSGVEDNSIVHVVRLSRIP
jgi:chromosome segregation ATPase